MPLDSFVWPVREVFSAGDNTLPVPVPVPVPASFHSAADIP